MVQNDVFQFFFVAASGVSLAIFLFGIVPYKVGKYVTSFIRRRRGVNHAG